MVDRQPDVTLPDSIMLEQNVLGGLMLDNHAWEPVHAILNGYRFRSEDHTLIFGAMRDLREKGEPCDAVTISERLEVQGRLDDAGRLAYIGGLAKETASSANVEAYARALANRAAQEAIRRVISKDLRDLDYSEDPRAILESIRSRLDQVESRLPSGASPYVAVKVGEFLDREFPPRRNLLDPWLPVQGLAMIHAPRGVGKTHVGLGVGVAVATGEQFLRWRAPKPASVLFIDGEMPASALQERLAHLVKTASGARERFAILTPDLQRRGMPDLATFAGQRSIEAHVDRADLVIVDNLSTLCRTGIENESESWGVMQEWALALRSRGKSVLFIHHSGKKRAQRGTSRREDVLNTVITLRRPASYDPSEGAVFEVHFEKAREICGDDVAPFVARLETDRHGHQTWTTQSLEDSDAEKVIALYQDGITSPKEIGDELGGMNRGTVFRHLKKARTEGRIDGGST